jgi:hypothetical protein
MLVEANGYSKAAYTHNRATQVDTQAAEIAELQVQIASIPNISLYQLKSLLTYERRLLRVMK